MTWLPTFCPGARVECDDGSRWRVVEAIQRGVFVIVQAEGGDYHSNRVLAAVDLWPSADPIGDVLDRRQADPPPWCRQAKRTAQWPPQRTYWRWPPANERQPWLGAQDRPPSAPARRRSWA
jgi:hypothetical protein